MTEETDGEAAKEREVGGTVAVVERGGVFAELNIQDPVQAVFDGPVTAWGTAQCLGIEPMITTEGALFPVFGRVRVANGLLIADDDHHRIQVRPLRLPCEVFWTLQDVCRALFDATV